MERLKREGERVKERDKGRTEMERVEERDGERQCKEREEKKDQVEQQINLQVSPEGQTGVPPAPGGAAVSGAYLQDDIPLLEVPVPDRKSVG